MGLKSQIFGLSCLILERVSQNDHNMALLAPLFVREIELTLKIQDKALKFPDFKKNIKATIDLALQKSFYHGLVHT